jgi:hypothetical protein
VIGSSAQGRPAQNVRIVRIQRTKPIASVQGARDKAHEMPVGIATGIARSMQRASSCSLLSLLSLISLLPGWAHGSAAAGWLAAGPGRVRSRPRPLWARLAHEREAACLALPASSCFLKRTFNLLPAATATCCYLLATIGYWLLVIGYWRLRVACCVLVLALLALLPSSFFSVRGRVSCVVCRVSCVFRKSSSFPEKDQRRQSRARARAWVSGSGSN